MSLKFCRTAVLKNIHFQRQFWRCSVKKLSLKFTGKYSCQSLFLISAAALRLQLYPGTDSERVNMKSDITAKLNIYHLCATALVLIRSQRRKREKNRRGRRYWIRPLFADSAASLSKLSFENERNR